MLMPIKAVIYLIRIVVLFFLTNCLSAENSSDIIKNLPEKDRDDLKELFDYFIDSGHFAYTLFDDKPVSLAAFSTAEIPKINISKKGRQKLIFLQDNIHNKWNTWKKYKSRFPVTQYIIIEERPRFNTNVTHVFLINKKLFIKKVNDNLEIFQKILGKEITGEYLIGKVEQSGQLRSNIRQNEYLLGILLGYGRHNSQLYQKREDILLSYKQYKRLLLKDSPVLDTLDRKADALTEILQPFGDLNSFPRVVRPVAFVADHKHPETIKMKKKYRLSQNKIAYIYARGNRLEITLEALTRDN
jgi:hypothetical protein